MINNYNKTYIEKLHFEEARAIFMMLTRMIDVKANYKNKYKTLQCETCGVEENTLHLFKCKKYHDISEKADGETLEEILQKNNERKIASILKEIIKRKENENGEKKPKKKPKKKPTNTAPLPIRLSLPDGRV